MDLPFLKPCWWSAREIDSWRGARIMLSRILTAGHSREMGRKLCPWSAGLLGLRSGIIRPNLPDVRDGRLVDDVVEEVGNELDGPGPQVFEHDQ